MKKFILKLFRLASISIIVLLTSTSFVSAQVNIQGLEGVLNGVVSIQQQNQTTKQQYADRTNVDEIIDPASGSLTLRQTDANLPGKDGLDLTIGRVFNSSNAELGTERVKVTSSYDYSTQTVNGWVIDVYDYDVNSGQWISYIFGPFATDADASAYADSITGVYLKVVRYCTINVNYTNYTITQLTGPDKHNYYRSMYDLGAGWSFSFPSVQIDEIEGNKFIYYHDGTGASYRVDLTSGTGSNLVNYQGRDVQFLEDNGTYINEDNITSKYKYISADNRTTYFGADGRLLGIRDRFGNEIKFRHTMRKIYSAPYLFDDQKDTYPFISQITDSVGRKINFTYDNTLNDSTFNGENITVTVVDPGNTSSYSIVYTKWRADVILSQNGSQIDRYYAPYLLRVTNPVGSTTYYNNAINEKKFSFVAKNFNNPSSDVELSLTNIEYPASYTNYQYETALRNLGPDGLHQENRVKARFDQQKRINSNNQWVQEGDINHIDYTYNGDCTGYPTYYDEDSMTESYTFWSQASVKNGVATRTVYNGKKQETSVIQTASNGEQKVYNNLTFDTRFIYKPTSSEHLEYASDGTVAKHLYTAQTYKDWGGIESTTKELTYAQMNDTNLKAKLTTTYSYTDTNYPYFLTQKQWYQNDSTLLTEIYTYDAAGREKTYTNPKGEVVTNNYTVNSDGKVVTVETTKQLENAKVSKNVAIYGQETSYAYPSTVKTYYTDSEGVYKETKIDYTYNMLLGTVQTETDNSNHITSYSYDNVGRVLAITEPTYTDINSQTHSLKRIYQYWDGCYLTYSDKVIDPDNVGLASNIVYSYEEQHNSNGSTEYYLSTYDTYDTYGNLRHEHKWDNEHLQWVNKSEYKYDDLARPVYEKDAENNITTYAYNAWGELSEKIDSSGNLYKQEYDLKANTVSSYFVAQANIAAYRSNPTYNGYKEDVIDCILDQWGRTVEHRAYPSWPNTTYLSERYSYDYDGNLLTYIDPKGNLNSDSATKKYEYDQLNRVVSIKDALNQITSIGYDKLGDISYVEKKESASAQPVRIYSKSYDERGLLNTKADQGSQNTNTSFDELGLNTKVTDRNNSVFENFYDEKNRLKSSIGINTQGNSIQYKYLYDNPLGVREIDDYKNGPQIGYRYFDYNSFGLVAATANVYSGDNYTSVVGSQYDKADKLTSISVRNNTSSNFFTNYVFNKERLSKVQTNGLETADSTGQAYAVYQYYPDGRLQTITYPTLTDGSVLVTLYNYNKLGQLQSMSNKKNSLVLSQFSYTYDANGNIETVTDGAGNVNKYYYDKLDRLSETYLNNTLQRSYIYDLMGNRQTLKDANPKLNLDSTSYQYDVLNRLTQVNKGGQTTSIKYSTDGLRYQKSAPTKTTQYYYNQGGKVIAEGDASNNITADYVWGPDRALVKKDKTTGNDYYYLYNGHGDVIQIIDTNGNVVNNYEYDEWGNISSLTESIDNPFKYCGEIYDQETGLYYLRARYYDPTLGRFISEDSYEGQVTAPLSLNLYTYCQDDPINAWDPSGHKHITRKYTFTYSYWEYYTYTVTGVWLTGPEKGQKVTSTYTKGIMKQKTVSVTEHEFTNLNFIVYETPDGKGYNLNYSDAYEGKRQSFIEAGAKDEISDIVGLTALDNKNRFNKAWAWTKVGVSAVSDIVTVAKIAKAAKAAPTIIEGVKVGWSKLWRAIVPGADDVLVGGVDMSMGNNPDYTWLTGLIPVFGTYQAVVDATSDDPIKGIFVDNE